MANPTWTPALAVATGAVIIDPAGNVQQCITAGITGALLPSFAQTLGATTTDASVVWSCVAVLSTALPEALTSLPIPNFITDAAGLDPAAIVRDMIATFEAVTGRMLQPAQIERLFLNLMAYRESLVRNAIQLAAMQNLLAFAGFPAIDHLGHLLDVTRLSAVGASTILQFTLVATLNQPLIIPQGTLAGTSDGQFQFATLLDATIPAQALTVTVAAVCTTAGPAANGYPIGSVNALIRPNALIQAVANTIATNGGADIESTDALRERIREAPNQFSTAGTGPGYEFFARSLDPTIIDVRCVQAATVQSGVDLSGQPIFVVTPAVSPGSVAVYVLTDSGVLSPALLAKLNTLLGVNDPESTVRALCDQVVVAGAIAHPYSVGGPAGSTVVLQDFADVQQTRAAIATVVTALAQRRALSLQQDIVPEEWIAAIQEVGGVYRAAIQIFDPPTASAPLTAPSVLQPQEYAKLTSLLINLQSRGGTRLGTVTL